MVDSSFGGSVRLANNYAFRTEQASAAALGTVGGFVDSGAGRELACNVTSAAVP